MRETRASLPAKPGRPECFDCEYERPGMANIFMFVEPLVGVKRAQVTAQRTRKDWAQAVKRLCDVDYPHAQVIRLGL